MLNLHKYLKKGQSIVLESTTYPGTTEEVVASKLKIFKLGENFFVGYSPERRESCSQKNLVFGTLKNCIWIY